MFQIPDRQQNAQYWCWCFPKSPKHSAPVSFNCLSPFDLKFHANSRLLHAVFTIACINVPGRSVALSVCLPDCLCLSVCLSVRPSVCPSVFYLSVVRPPYWWSTEPHQLGGYILDSVNMCKAFWWISKSFIGKRRDLKLEKCFLYLSPITLRFLELTY